MALSHASDAGRYIWLVLFVSFSIASECDSASSVDGSSMCHIPPDRNIPAATTLASKSSAFLLCSPRQLVLVSLILVFGFEDPRGH